MLAYMTEGNEDTKCSGQANKTNPNTFHEAVCKPQTDLEGLTRVTPKQLKM